MRRVDSERKAANSHAQACGHGPEIREEEEPQPPCFERCNFYSRWSSEHFEAHAASLRPPVSEDELKFRARIPRPARKMWDITRLALDHYIPCKSSYLAVELQQEFPIITPMDMVLIVIALGMLPLYFLYFELTFESVVGFFFFRVLVPGGLVMVRMFRPWRGHVLALLFSDVVVFSYIFGGLYNEIGLIIKMSNIEFNDSRLQALEHEWFGCQPAVEFSREVDIKAVGEYLHWCYFSFYGIMFGPALLTWWRYPRLSYYRVVTTQLMVMGLCGVCWIYFPAKGPYWTLNPRPAGEVGYAMPHVTQWLVETGSSLGTACPSSHCALATGMWLAMAQETKEYNLLFLLFVPGLWLSTVYGGFHYVVDSFFGVFAGALAALLAHMLVSSWLKVMAVPTGVDSERGIDSDGFSLTQAPLAEQGEPSLHDVNML